MDRCRGLLLSLVLVLAGVSVGALVVLFRAGPLPDEEAVIALGTVPAWHVRVTYKPNRQVARVALRMDGMSAYRTVAYRVDGTEPWTPRWQGRIDGSLGEFVTLESSWIQTPHPMTGEGAKRAATGMRVTLQTDRGEREIAFVCCAQPALPPWSDHLHDLLRPNTRPRLVG